MEAAVYAIILLNLVEENNTVIDLRSVVQLYFDTFHPELFVRAVILHPVCERLSSHLTTAQTQGFVFVFLLPSPFWKEAIASLHLLNSPIRYKGVATHEG